MALSTFQMLIVVGMVTTGTLNTISATLQLARRATGTSGIPEYFQHPYIQAMFMMLGETLCMGAFMIMKFINRKKPDTSGELPMNPMVLFPASFMDLLGTALGYMGLAFCKDGGTFQMLRATAMMWAGLLSIPFLKRGLKWFQVLGMVIIAGGLAIKASEMFLPDFEEKDYCASILDNSTATTPISTTTQISRSSTTTIKPVLDEALLKPIGYALIVVGEFFHGLQFVYEEKFLVKYNLPPLKVVGWEGVFGFITMGLLLWPLYFIRVGAPIGSGPDGRFEDAIDGFTQIFGGQPDVWLVMWTLGNMCSIACFNFAGVSVTAELSSTTRAVLDNLRIIFIWAFFLIPFGDMLCEVRDEFHYLHPIGLIVLLVGIWFYNDIIIMPMIRKYILKKDTSSQEEIVEKK